MSHLEIYNDECPKHENPEKKEYTFGRYEDATVITFRGCGCAVVIKNNGWNDMSYHTSYNEASGVAKMTVAQAATW